jgi:hypothetical protein
MMELTKNLDPEGDYAALDVIPAKAGIQGKRETARRMIAATG